MNIIKEWGVTDKRQRYNLMEATGTNLRDMVGQRLELKAYMIVETADPATGEMHKALKGETVEGEIFGTSSASFISGMERFLLCMETDACTEMGVGKQRSQKTGHEYLTFIA